MILTDNVLLNKINVKITMPSQLLNITSALSEVQIYPIFLNEPHMVANSENEAVNLDLGKLGKAWFGNFPLNAC